MEQPHRIAVRRELAILDELLAVARPCRGERAQAARGDLGDHGVCHLVVRPPPGIVVADAHQESGGRQILRAVDRAVERGQGGAAIGPAPRHAALVAVVGVEPVRVADVLGADCRPGAADAHLCQHGPRLLSRGRARQQQQKGNQRRSRAVCVDHGSPAFCHPERSEGSFATLRMTKQTRSPSSLRHPRALQCAAFPAFGDLESTWLISD